MKFLIAFVASVMLAVAVPAQARTTVHGIAVKTVKRTVAVATYPVRHPKRTLRAPVHVVVAVAKHL